MEVDCLKINTLDIQQNKNSIGYVSLCTKHPRKFQVPPGFTTFQDVMPGLHVRGCSRPRRVPGVGTLPRRHTRHWAGTGQGTQSSPLESKTESTVHVEKQTEAAEQRDALQDQGSPCSEHPTFLPGSSKEAGHPAAGGFPALLGPGPHHLPGEFLWAPLLQLPPQCRAGSWHPVGSSRTQPPSQAGNTQGASVFIASADLGAEGEQNAPHSISRHL